MNMMDKNTIRKEPKGVVLIIGPWNYPLQLLLLPLVGAIAAGNCVVMKPSEVSFHTSQFIADNLLNYLNRQAYSIVTGAVDETERLLTQKLDHIFYTGSGHVGQLVMAAAAKHLTPVTLELGGKSPALVAPDTHLSTAANRILWGKFFNAGQTCVAPDYVLVLKADMDLFVDTCRQILYERYGDDPQQSDSYPRLISERRFEAIQRPLDQLDPKKVLMGGKSDRKDLYVAPTLVGPLEPNDALFMEQEIFGPVLPIVPVEDMDEAIEIINSNDDPSIRNKVSQNTTSGAILVNDTLMHAQESSLPFGGVGASGMGAYHGPKSFDTFSYERSMMIKSIGLEMVMKARYPPYNDDKQALFSLLTIGLPDAVTDKFKTFFHALGSAYRVLFTKESK
ncbi:hypothetical protein RO3G_10832 [Rhizopus delemar RA 99-880]|uniref:Aldehyde dehydrogenase domain-containing protein n=1 Tax=Rhizopus delemar (strain RA 99-880 / ATCC MYA-4621 / FGSC 9543 / NRRL 43880) TaxID=246409 RepID=I1CCE1_RHIO9|nr:hypothetical protein RO3G_10832 [Rhizopus delemar RA 99-880]|eukprot:EIE86121.1 hypothetical protein RO3G_10832 [Rhizopus delemar RA 99-880]